MNKKMTPNNSITILINILLLSVVKFRNLHFDYILF